MSSPSTKRDQRRETRKAQMQRQQEERRRERERAHRNQMVRRYGVIGGGILVVIILALVIAHFVAAASPSTGLHAADGSPVDNITCVPSEGQAQHFHDQLYIFVNGQQVAVPQDVGIVLSQGCLYSLHTHDSSGIIHIESDSPNQTYYLGNFFDIWGQSLTSTNFMGNKIDSSHKFEMLVYDANGTAGIYTGVPAKLPLSSHLTIYLLYNSPDVKTAPFKQWNGL